MKSLFSVEGKVALVTGGSRGIGLMIARGYVESGAKVYITARKAEACNEAAAELSKLGTCLALPSDVATVAGVKKLVAALRDLEPALDILVNNAGANWAEPLDTYSESGWDKVQSTNLKGPFFLTRDLVPMLKARATHADPSRVVNIASIDGMHVPGLETYAYSSSKAGMIHMTRVLARKLAPEHITVNAISPGPFESKMMEETLRRFGSSIARSCPRGRIGEPDDMAGAALYLASRAGAYLTGVCIPVDGGISTCV
jgi:NAD(P)-dependent dehydrogenase (short-subunit alcohol dehydrogenase family)